MPHLDFLVSVVKYEQLSGYSVLVAHFMTRISWKVCSLEIMEMWPRTLALPPAIARHLLELHQSCASPAIKIEEKQGSQYSFIVTLRTHLSCSPPPPKDLILEA